MIKTKASLELIQLKPVHLFREELLAIEHVLTIDLAGENFKVSFDQYESDDLASIPEDQNLTNKIFLKVSEPYLSVDINKNYSRIYASEDTLKSRGASEKIFEILTDSTESLVFISRRALSWIMQTISSLSLCLILIITFEKIFSDTSRIGELIAPLDVMLIFVILLFPLGFISSLQIGINTKPIVEFGWNKYKKSFWIRSKDQIIVGVIIGIILLFLEAFF